MNTDNVLRLGTLEKEIFSDFMDRSNNSYAHYQRARNSLVGGVSGSVRYFAPYPLYFNSGSGSHVTDIDQNTYIDCVLGNGSLLLGHSPEGVMDSIRGYQRLGTMMMNPELVAEVAEQIVSLVPTAERVRFVNSGTEAVMMAMRFARAHTGKDKILKLTGAYHGQADQVLTGLDPSRRSAGAGIPKGAHNDIVVADLGDNEGIDQLLASGEVAGILVDPSMHHTGLWAGNTEIYRSLQDRVRAAGGLLIFDEVIAGFRLDAGGGQAFFGVEPDLSTFAKALASGERLGAIVGSEAVMRVADSSKERSPGPFAFQSGTSNDATAGLAAAKGALVRYQNHQQVGDYGHIAELGNRLAQGLKGVFSAEGVDVHCNHLGPMVKLFFVSEPKSYADCLGVNTKLQTLFHLALISEGVLTIPGSNDFFLSFAHSTEDINRVISAVGRTLQRYDFKSVLRV